MVAPPRREGPHTMSNPFSLSTFALSKRWRFIITLGITTLLLLSCDSNRESNRIFFTSDRDGNLEIYSVSIDGVEETNITRNSSDEFTPILSPDGKHVAFLTKSNQSTSIHVMKTDGTGRTVLTPEPGDYDIPIWSPESDRLAYVYQQENKPQIYIVSTNGNDPLLLTSISGNQVGGWSGGENEIVFSVGNGDNPGIYIRNPDGVNQIKLKDSENGDIQPIWSPDSTKIAFLRSNADGNSDIYVMKRDESKIENLTNSEGSESDISWSPDGKQILYVLSSQDKPSEIYVIETEDSHSPKKLTSNQAVDNQPVWSPNGSRIAFVSYLDGDAEIFVMDVDGKNQTRLTNNESEDTDPSW